MSDPLSLFPMALAAGGGRIDGLEGQQLVAAGLTLLQRSAPLVRALDGHRAAIVLSHGPAYLSALAASVGRGAVLIDPRTAEGEIARRLADANVGAVFTVAALAPRVPSGLPLVLLDDAPRHARVVTDGGSRDIDLGSHVGLPLEGSPDAEGLDEECAIVFESDNGGHARAERLQHRHLISDARATIQSLGLTAQHHTRAVLPFWERIGLVTLGAAMMSGGRVTTGHDLRPPASGRAGRPANG